MKKIMSFNEFRITYVKYKFKIHYHDREWSCPSLILNQYPSRVIKNQVKNFNRILTNGWLTPSKVQMGKQMAKLKRAKTRWTVPNWASFLTNWKDPSIFSHQKLLLVWCSAIRQACLSYDIARYLLQKRINKQTAYLYHLKIQRLVMLLPHCWISFLLPFCLFYSMEKTT